MNHQAMYDDGKKRNKVKTGGMNKFAGQPIGGMHTPGAAKSMPMGEGANATGGRKRARGRFGKIVKG